MEQQIVNFIKKNGKVSRPDLEKKFNLSDGIMGNLIQKGMVKTQCIQGNIYYFIH